MGNKTLRRKISLFILIPLILGTVVTAVVSWLPIYEHYSYWIQDVITDMINDQGEVLLEVSMHIATLTSGAVQIPTNYMMMVSALIENYYEDNYSINPDFTGTKNYQSALELIQRKVNFTLRNESMWYMGPDYYSSEDLPKDSMQDLHDSAVFDMFFRPVLTNYTANRITQYFHAFNSTGLMYLYPSLALYFLDDQTGFQSCDYHTDQYDPRCTAFYAAVANAPDHFLAVLPDPYLGHRNGTLVHSACKGLWSGGQLTLVGCVEFNITDVTAIASRLTVGEGSYAFALSTDGSVLFHPSMNTSQINTIAELEFNNQTIDDEAQKFANDIVPLFANEGTTLTTYEKQKHTMLIAITPVYVMLAMSKIYVHQFSVGVVMPEHHLLERFNPLKDESDRILIIEVLIFFGVMAGIIAAGWL